MEYVYFDKPTSDMLLKLDPDRPAGVTPNFCIDDSGSLLIRYFDGRKFVRNFRVPSSKEPEQTQKFVLSSMQERIERNRTKRKLRTLLLWSGVATVISITIGIMVSLM